MEIQQVNSKGEHMEELLRNYFLSLGYYVVRGVQYKYEGLDVTDVDLYLYGRSSSLTRDRINVDIKNKKSPQAFERILWANGLKKLLGFNSCIVATTDQKPLTHSFGQMHDTLILDGAFLQKLRQQNFPDRLTEESLLQRLSKYKSYKTYDNKDWKFLYESSKSKLLTEQDFSGFNSTLLLLQYFLEKAVTDIQKREDATRMIYLILSHLLIITDFIVKDIAFLDTPAKEKKLSEGFNFGNLGKEGVDKILSIAIKISGNKSQSSIAKSLENADTDILKEFFGKNEIAKKLHQWAKELEVIGYSKNLINPNQIDSALKSVLMIILDYSKIERRKFFNIFSESIISSHPSDLPSQVSEPTQQYNKPETDNQQQELPLKSNSGLVQTQSYQPQSNQAVKGQNTKNVQAKSNGKKTNPIIKKDVIVEKSRENPTIFGDVNDSE